MSHAHRNMHIKCEFPLGFVKSAYHIQIGGIFFRLHHRTKIARKRIYERRCGSVIHGCFGSVLRSADRFDIKLFQVTVFKDPKHPAEHRFKDTRDP